MGWLLVAKILYNAMSEEAKSKCTLSVVGELDSFSNLNNIMMDKSYPSFFMPQNKNTAYLNGNLTLPDDVNLAPLVFKNVSDANGVVDVSLTIKLDKAYASGGFTLLFDTNNNVYATNFTVKWYLGAELKHSKIIENNRFDYCTIFEKVKNFDKLIINLRKMNLPLIKPIITGFDIGVSLIFSAKDIESVNIFEEIDPFLTTLSSNTCEFIIKSDVPILDVFKYNQQIKVYHFNNQMGEFYTKQIEKLSRDKYKIICVDRLFYLDNILYEGMHTEDYLGSIFWGSVLSMMLFNLRNQFGINYRLDDTFEVEEFGSYYKTDTPRNLLQIILFMLGGALDLSRDGIFKIYKLNKTNKKVIDIKYISSNTKLEQIEYATDLKLKHYELGDCYNGEIEEEEKITDLVQGTHYVKFDRPYAFLRVEGGNILSDGNNLGSGFGLGANIICDSIGGTLYGREIYIRESLLEIVLPDTESETVRNVKEFNDIYSMGRATVNLVKNRLLEFYKNPYIYKCTTDYQNVKLGDFVEIDDPIQGLIKGWVISLAYNLNGNKIVYDMEMKLC